tara:strand:- start:14 stop:1243 length:1230 start_codon:yes stop_codon:yes gene_type:complete
MYNKMGGGGSKLGIFLKSKPDFIPKDLDFIDKFAVKCILTAYDIYLEEEPKESVKYLKPRLTMSLNVWSWRSSGKTRALQVVVNNNKFKLESFKKWSADDYKDLNSYDNIMEAKKKIDFYSVCSIFDWTDFCILFREKAMNRILECEKVLKGKENLPLYYGRSTPLKKFLEGDTFNPTSFHFGLTGLALVKDFSELKNYFENNSFGSYKYNKEGNVEGSTYVPRINVSEYPENIYIVPVSNLKIKKINSLEDLDKFNSKYINKDYEFVKPDNPIVERLFNDKLRDEAYFVEKMKKDFDCIEIRTGIKSSEYTFDFFVTPTYYNGEDFDNKLKYKGFRWDEKFVTKDSSGKFQYVIINNLKKVKCEKLKLPKENLLNSVSFSLKKTEDGSLIKTNILSIEENKTVQFNLD